jgi:hypothetical protein
MKSLYLPGVLTIAAGHQAVAVLGSPPQTGQLQAESVAYYYHGRYYPYLYHGRYYYHRAWHNGHWRYY